LADSELNGFIRLKSIIAQPGSDCYVMDEDAWTRNIKNNNEDVYKYMELFKIIRELAYEFINSVDIKNWNNQYFIRTYKGQETQITIEKWLEVYNEHFSVHLDYLDKIKKDYDENKINLTL
jgi:hypothetical protein